MENYDLIIIGSGASGLMAGVTALKSGVKNVLIIEQEESLGGNLNLFIHNGFGEFYYGESLTGPEFSSMLIDEFIKFGGQYLIDTKVLELHKDKSLTYLNPSEGIKDIKAKAIILATGCREKFIGNVKVVMDQFTGIFTTVAAHRLINFQGYLPGKEVAIRSRGIRSILLARRLIIEGAKIKAIITNESYLSDEEINVISNFQIPIIYNSELVEIGGSERVEFIRIINKNGEVKNIACDSVILETGYYPEVELLTKINVNPQVNENYKYEIDGVYGCGTVVGGIDKIFTSGEEGLKVGKVVSEYLL